MGQIIAVDKLNLLYRTTCNVEFMQDTFIEMRLDL